VEGVALGVEQDVVVAAAVADNHLNDIEIFTDNEGNI